MKSLLPQVLTVGGFHLILAVFVMPHSKEHCEALAMEQNLHHLKFLLVGSSFFDRCLGQLPYSLHHLRHHYLQIVDLSAQLPQLPLHLFPKGPRSLRHARPEPLNFMKEFLKQQIFHFEKRSPRLIWIPFYLMVVQLVHQQIQEVATLLAFIQKQVASQMLASIAWAYWCCLSFFLLASSCSPSTDI